MENIYDIGRAQKQHTYIYTYNDTYIRAKMHREKTRKKRKLLSLGDRDYEKYAFCIVLIFFNEHIFIFCKV